ncbi:MAG TPA: NrfD/PsrC family molybdoenzyme membrane anchor subunit [Streptosporangiaceae bacterium]|nr:NrfD/PsrC family molybdoenzyme membrane anchor subunit [Streptosporangiaceae bacterium]
MSPTAAAHAPLPEPAWGTLLAVYFVLIGLPSGITLVSWWLRDRQGVTAAILVERQGSWIAMAALIGASILLVADLGRPERFFLMLTRFDNLGSPIAVGAKLIALKTFLLAIVLYAMERRRRTAGSAEVPAGTGVTGVTYVLPWLLVAASFGLAIYPASVLSRSWASPLAGSSGAALIFLLTALLMGLAAAILIAVAAGGADPDGTGRMLRLGRRALLGVLGLFGLTLAFEGLSLGGSPPDRHLLDEVLAEGSGATFWGLVVLIGIVVPAVGLAFAHRRRAAFVVSAAGVLIGAAATRYLIFAVGR